MLSFNAGRMSARSPHAHGWLLVLVVHRLGQDMDNPNHRGTSRRTASRVAAMRPPAEGNDMASVGRREEHTCARPAAVNYPPDHQRRGAKCVATRLGRAVDPEPWAIRASKQTSPGPPRAITGVENHQDQSQARGGHDEEAARATTGRRPDAT